MRERKSVSVVNVRLVRESSLYSPEPIKTADDVLGLVAKELAAYDREVFAILNLKTNGQIINLNICSIGTLNATMVSPREVFKSCILSNAASFIALHNHPSGSVNPSREDMETTKRLKECGDLLDIRMLDHIIIAGETGERYSFREHGLIERSRGAMSYAER